MDEKWHPCKRRDFIAKLKKLRFSSPRPGTRHFFVKYGKCKQTSKGSCSELSTRLYLAVEIGVFDKAASDELLESTRKISAMLHNYIKVRKERF